MWRLILAVLLADLLVTVAGLAAFGPVTAAAQFVTRNTARVSGLVFLAAFLPDRPLRLPAWIRNGRPLVAFAVAQACHLASIIWLDAAGPMHPLRQGAAAAIVGGSLAYTLTFGLAVAGEGSLDPAWARLRTASLYYIYLIFLTGFAGGAYAGRDVVHAALALVFAAGLVARIIW